MRLTDGLVHRLAALLGSLILCSCSAPTLPSGNFHTASSVRFSGTSIITTAADGDVTVVGNADHVAIGNARRVTVIGNFQHVSSTCPPASVEQIGNFNTNHL
jgi:hypothetical protein